MSDLDRKTVPVIHLVPAGRPIGTTACGLPTETPDRPWHAGLGMVTVYDHEGTYVGCMGRESWEWLLAQGYESVRERIERTEALAARYEEALRWIEGLDRDLDRRGSVRLDEICEVARVALEEDA